MALRVFSGAVGRIAGDSLALWLAQMGGVALSVVATVFVTRALGPDGRGVYTWLLTLAGVGAHGALFGMDTSNRRLAAEEPGRVPALLRMNMLIVGGMGSLLALALAVLALPLPGSGGDPRWMLLAMATMPLTALGMALGSVLIAQHRIKRVALQLLLPKAVMAAAFGLMVAGAWVTVGHALLFNLLAVAVAAGLPLWWLRRELAQGHTLPLRPYVAQVWRTCSAVYLAGLSYYVMQKVDVLMVGYYLGNAATGYFGVASNMADLMVTPVSMVALLVGTRLAAKDVGGGPLAVMGMAAAVMGLAVLGCVFVYAIAPWLVVGLFGAAFAPSVAVLRLLCLAVAGLCLFLLMNAMLVATARARHLALPALLGAVCNVGLNVLLIPRFGLVGACWASIVAYWLAAFCAAAMVGCRMIGWRGVWRIFIRK